MAAETISVRLTGPQLDILDEIITDHNEGLRKQGLPPLVTRGVLLRTLVLREIESRATKTIRLPGKRPKNIQPRDWETLKHP